MLGAFEELVLLALVRQGAAAYGVSIRRELEEQCGASVTMGAVYSTLDRLEAKRMVAPRHGEQRESRRGRPRRYYDIQAAGVAALERTRAVRATMWDGVELPVVAETGGS